MKKLCMLLLALGLLTGSGAQTVKQVLWLGNSYTYVNDLPLMTSQVAQSLGDSIIYDMYAPGGYRFDQHYADATTLAKIRLRAWDYVVLQEQSQMPSFPPSQVASQVYPYAKSLCDSIHANDSCTVPLFYMTWGRKNGDASNCANYPILCTYAGMQSRLRDSYLEMGRDNRAEVSPVGSAWKQVRDSFPPIELYNPDESHPSLHGSYLAACTFYASIFKKSAVGAAVPVGITANDGLMLQQIATHTVLDSLWLWYMDTVPPSPSFTFTHNGGGNVQFTNTSSHAWQYEWDLGDGTYDTANSPAHTYAPGTYTVTLTARRRCEDSSVTDTVQITITAMSEALQEAGFTIGPVPVRDELLVKLYGMENEIRFILTDIRGRLLMEGHSRTPSFTLQTAALPSGLYVLEVTDGKTRCVKRFSK